MKKRLLIAALLVILSQGSVFASGGRPHKIDNLNFLGSDDHKSKRPVHQTPVSVPEPSTLILVGAGLIAIAVNKIKK